LRHAKAAVESAGSRRRRRRRRPGGRYVSTALVEARAGIAVLPTTYDAWHLLPIHIAGKALSQPTVTRSTHPKQQPVSFLDDGALATKAPCPPDSAGERGLGRALPPRACSMLISSPGRFGARKPFWRTTTTASRAVGLQLSKTALPRCSTKNNRIRTRCCDVLVRTRVLDARVYISARDPLRDPSWPSLHPIMDGLVNTSLLVLPRTTTLSSS